MDKVSEISTSVSQKDIAKRAGVSVMTVSKALRNQRKVSAKTKERILEIAAEMGYTRHPLVDATMARVAQGRRIVDRPPLAFITSFRTPEAWRDYPHIVRMRAAAFERAEQLGFHMNDFHFRTGSLSGDRLTDILLARGVLGCVVAPFSIEEREAVRDRKSSLRLNDRRLTWFFIGTQFPDLGVDNVNIDYFSSILHCIQKLKELGHKRLVLALAQEESARPQHRFLSSYLAIEYFDQSHRHDYVEPFVTPSWNASSLKSLATYLRQERADAVILADRRAAEFIGERRREQKPVIFSLHANVFQSDHIDFGMDQQPEEQARIAVESVSDRIKVGRFGLPRVPRLYRIGATFVDFRNGLRKNQERNKIKSEA